MIKSISNAFKRLLHLGDETEPAAKKTTAPRKNDRPPRRKQGGSPARGKSDGGASERPPREARKSRRAPAAPPVPLALAAPALEFTHFLTAKVHLTSMNKG